MTNTDERDLLRLLTGELAPAAGKALAARLGREPDLAASYARLERVWRGLDLPAPAPAPPGFAGRVAVRAREDAEGRAAPDLRQAPLWVRAGAAVALVAGVALGVGLGLWRADSGDGEGLLTAQPPSLSESYWDTVGSTESGGVGL